MIKSAIRRKCCKDSLLEKSKIMKIEVCDVNFSPEVELQ